jgi:hypothetical protein
MQILFICCLADLKASLSKEIDPFLAIFQEAGETP